MHFPRQGGCHAHSSQSYVVDVNVSTRKAFRINEALTEFSVLALQRFVELPQLELFGVLGLCASHGVSHSASALVLSQHRSDRAASLSFQRHPAHLYELQRSFPGLRCVHVCRRGHSSIAASTAVLRQPPPHDPSRLSSAELRLSA